MQRKCTWLLGVSCGLLIRKTMTPLLPSAGPSCSSSVVCWTDRAIAPGARNVRRSTTAPLAAQSRQIRASAIQAPIVTATSRSWCAALRPCHEATAVGCKAQWSSSPSQAEASSAKAASDTLASSEAPARATITTGIQTSRSVVRVFWVAAPRSAHQPPSLKCVSSPRFPHPKPRAVQACTTHYQSYNITSFLPTHNTQRPVRAHATATPTSYTELRAAILFSPPSAPASQPGDPYSHSRPGVDRGAVQITYDTQRGDT